MTVFVVIAALSLVLALLPLGQGIANLVLYRRPTAAPPLGTAVSILIPARNEESGIAAAVEAALLSRGVEVEVVVLDDHSTDRTAEIVRSIAARDPRVRLESAPPLPPGWSGKQHACQMLAGLARHSVLLFQDADVRLSLGWAVLDPLPLAAVVLACLAVAAGLIFRLLLAARFRQSIVGALLHPVGVLIMLAIQWSALLRARRGKPSEWRGRNYQAGPGPGAP